MVFVTENVGEDGELVAFLDEAHGHAGDVVLQRNASVGMERQPPQTEAMEEEPLDSVISDTTRIVYWNSSAVEAQP